MPTFNIKSLMREEKRLQSKKKPCPLCGGKAVFSDYDGDKFIGCPKCSLFMNYRGTKRLAISHWNQRTNPLTPKGTP